MSQEIINYEQVNSANLAIYSSLRLALWKEVLSSNDSSINDVKIAILDSQCPSCNKFIDANHKKCPHCSCEFNLKTTKPLKKTNQSGKGRKFCPGCDFYIAVRTFICDCGYDHVNKVQTQAKEKENKLNNIKRKKVELTSIGEVNDLDILLKNDRIKNNYLALMTAPDVKIEIRKLAKELNRKRDQIWIFNLKLVWEFVNRFHPKSGCQHLKREDLVSEGNFGVLEAINHFDHDVKGVFDGKNETVSFSTYANYWIKKKIIDAIIKKEKEIRIPEHIITVYKNFINYYNEFKKNNDREPYIEDIMKDKGLKEKKARGLLFAKEYKSAIGISMDDVNKFSDSEVENKKLHANLKFDNGSLDTYRLTNSINESLIEFNNINWDTIQFRKEKYREVFYSLRGICGFPEMSKSDIAEHYDLSKLTIDKIEADTTERIRKQLEGK